jgi:hypothetical protein
VRWIEVDIRIASKKIGTKGRRNSKVLVDRQWRLLGTARDGMTVVEALRTRTNGMGIGRRIIGEVLGSSRILLTKVVEEEREDLITSRWIIRIPIK